MDDGPRDAGQQAHAHERRVLGLVGPGRVGAVLAAAWRRAGGQVCGWTGGRSVSRASRIRVAALIDAVPELGLDELVERSELVLIAVPDDHLPGIVRELTERSGYRSPTNTSGAPVPGDTSAAGPDLYVHVSGLRGAHVLAPLAGPGVALVAAHPAMAFTGTAPDLERLPGIVWACTADPGPARSAARALVDAWGGRPVDVAEADRAGYHAALSHASNFLAILQAQALDLLTRIGIEDGRAVLGPLVRAALDDAVDAPGRSPWIGPVSRGDAGTVARHLQVLDDADTRAAYVALSRATAHRLRADGGLDSEAMGRLLAVLASGPPPPEPVGRPEPVEPVGRPEPVDPESWRSR